MKFEGSSKKKGGEFPEMMESNLYSKFQQLLLLRYFSIKKRDELGNSDSSVDVLPPERR